MNRRAVVLSTVVCLAVAGLLSAGRDGRSIAGAAGSAVRNRPGPPVLYAPPPDAPSLENRSPWFEADPLLVSGTEGYWRGEYLYQDHLYDDYGSDTGAIDPIGNASAGDLEYPTDRSRYGANAADLVEFRLAAREEAVAYRFTLNTLLATDSTIATMAWDTDRRAETGTDRLLRDPGAPFPGTDEAITVWGSGAEHTRFVAGQPPVTTPLRPTADLEANQLTVVVPRAVSDPQGVWRATAVTGLYDPPSGGWLRPEAAAGPGRPGGAGPTDARPAGIFNLAFRLDEPVTRRDTPPEVDQASALQAKAPARFAHDIDFDALATGEERTTVPRTGTQIRIFPSRLSLGEGKDPTRFPRYLGQLQPYSLTIPEGYEPGEPAPFTLNLHSLTRHHWQYHGSVGLAQLGEQRQSLVLTPLARGVDGWYQREAEYDVFEAWADAARHFAIDASRVAIAGYSMGGYGTYRLATLYPDLFGAAMTVVGPPGEGVWPAPAPPSGGWETLTNQWLDNARHVPFLNVVAAEDEVVPLAANRAQSLGAPELGIRGFDQLGYRYRFVVYSPAEHLTLAGLGYDVPMATRFLGEAEVERDPAHVTFAYTPAADEPDLGLVHDHAYWISALTVAPGASRGLIDARSFASGEGDRASRRVDGAGHGPLPRVDFTRRWSGPATVPAENRLALRLNGVAGARLDLGRAGLDLDEPVVLQITADAAGVLDLGERDVPYLAGNTRHVLEPAVSGG